MWPGAPRTAHWGVDDPAAFTGCERAQRRLFRRVYEELERRIERFTQLLFESLDRPSLEARLNEIGKSETPIAEENRDPCGQ